MTNSTRAAFFAASLAASFATSLALAAPPVADANALRDLVGAADYQAMGLAKLSAEEQAQLVHWIKLREGGRPVPNNTPTVEFGIDSMTLQATVAAPDLPVAVAAAAALPAIAPATAPAAAPAVAPAAAPAPRADAAFGSDQLDDADEPEELHAHIVGAFTGWDGQTVFKLDNGQVWRQAATGTYHYKAQDPEIIIEKRIVGYKLRLAATHRSVFVRRIK